MTKLTSEQMKIDFETWLKKQPKRKNPDMGKPLGAGAVKKYVKELMLNRTFHKEFDLYEDMREALNIKSFYEILTFEQYEKKEARINKEIEKSQEEKKKRGHRRENQIVTANSYYKNFLIERGADTPPPTIAKKSPTGTKKETAVSAYEISPEARAECIKHHGCKCAACGFDFGKVYGEHGDGYIHVHHLTPLAEIDEEYEIDPIEDLRPVCPNCHAMIHRYPDTPLTIKQLKALIKKPYSR